MLFNYNNRLTIICLTLFWFSALTCVHSASSQDLPYFRSLQVDKSQAAKVNHFYVAPYYGHHNHDSGRFISYFYQCIHHKNHHIWWDTGLLLNGSTIGYRYMSENQNLLIGSYLAYDRYGDCMLDGQSYSVYQMNAGLELASAYFGQLTANFYGVPVSLEALDSLCGKELNWAKDAWIKRRALKIVDDHGVSIKWITRPFAPSLRASIVLARSWIKQKSVYHWDKGRIDRVGIGLQYLLGESVHIDIQYVLRDAYQQGWRIGMKIGNMRAYREQNNLLGQLNRPPERYIPIYKTYQDVESAFIHNAPLKDDLFSSSGLGFGSIDSNLKRGVFDYFKAASADESSGRRFTKNSPSSVKGSSYVRRTQSAGHASSKKYHRVYSGSDSDESDGSIPSKPVRSKRSTKDTHRTNSQPTQSAGKGTHAKEFKTTHSANEAGVFYIRDETGFTELSDGRLIASTERVYYYPDGTIYKSELLNSYVAVESMQANSYYDAPTSYQAAFQRPTGTHRRSSPYSSQNYKSDLNYDTSYLGNNRAPKKKGRNTNAQAFPNKEQQFDKYDTGSKPNVSGYNTHGYHSLPRDRKPTVERDRSPNNSYSKYNYQSSSRNRKPTQEESSGNISEEELGKKESKFAELIGQRVQFVRDCSADELGKLYRRASLRIHPDRHRGKSEAEIKAANEEFSQLAEYYKILSKHKKT